MNLPNKLTILRVIMIPFFVVFMYLDFAAAKWIALGIIAREFIISGFRLIAAEKGVVIAAGIWGKLKTVVQMVMVCFLIGNLGGKVIFVIEQVLIYAALVLTIISLIDYLISNKNVLKD